MSDSWIDVVSNDYGGPDTDGFDNPSVSLLPQELHNNSIQDEKLDEGFDDSESEHTYATIDCGGECGGCVALIVDGEIVSGPPFHPNCGCTLDADDIENADYHDSHLHQDVASDRNVDTRDIKWLKKVLLKLGFYNPDSRAGESEKQLNQYPNQRLFDAIENFRQENKVKETGPVKPGHWTEVKINEKLDKARDMKKIITQDFKENVLRFEGIKQNFYLDSKGILTVGIGQNVNDFYAFSKLHILDKQTGNMLNAYQKEKLYYQIMQDISGGNFKEKSYANLEISKTDIYNQFERNLFQSYTELTHKISDFDKLPVYVQQALVDMQFNMGNRNFSEKKWPNLFQAIKKHDWHKAAVEASQRKDVQKDRRNWTYNMFLGGAK